MINQYNLDYSNIEYPKNKTILDFFHEQVKNNPDRIAVLHGDFHLSYSMLNKKSEELAGSLLKSGLKSQSIVALLFKPGVNTTISIFAILKTGCIYLPIDPSSPDGRIKYILSDSNAELILSESRLKGLLNIKDLFLKNNVIYIDELKKDDSEVVYANKSINPYDVCYIIYTSGTTGKPKGALIEHRNVVRLFFNDKPLFSFSKDDIWTMFHSYSFDFSVWEMYGALLNGGKLVILSDNIVRNTEKLRNYLVKQNVTVLNQTPSAFSILSLVDQYKVKPELNLRYLIFGGEALKPIILKEWGKKYPYTKIVNMYGITETTVHVTYKEIGIDEINANISNIGKPIPTLGIFLLDENKKKVPVGNIGEIYVGGAGVCRGYLNNPLLTDERFLMNPFSEGSLYKSGDLAQLKNNNEIEYIGRNDNQIKIRGYRIELKEIEKAIMKLEGIDNAFVIHKKRNELIDDIYAYILSHKNIESLNIVQQLRKELPNYMIPTKFIQIDKIPLTVNGKIDLSLLPLPVE